MTARWWILIAAVFLCLLWSPAPAHASTSQQTESAQTSDEEVPPGNPVIGDDRPGDVDPADDTRRYGLWALVAVCLVVAGMLLVSIERWESRRHQRDESS